MRRVIIVAVVVAGIVFTCIYSTYRVGRVRDQVQTYSNAIFASLEEGGDTLVERTRALTEYWNREEYILLRFVRHGQVDEITKSMAKLEPFARHMATPELEAEVNTILWQMEHIWQSEQLTLGNLF